MTDIFPESREEEILVSTINGEEYDKAPESRIEALLLELKEVIEEGGGGTTNYNLLQNKPSINSVTLTGNKSLEDLSIPTAADLAGKQDALPVAASGNDVAFNGDIQDGQGNTLSVLAEALTKTASGNPVVITDCAGGKARSLKTTINAIQDLHGYDKPWVGGAGKNKLNTTLANMKSGNSRGTWNGNVYTYQGLNFEPVFDNDGNFMHVKVTGTATALTQFYTNSDIFTPSGNFILNGCPNGGSYSTFDLRANGVNDTHTDCVDLGSGVTVNRTETGLEAMSVLITVRSGYNCGSDGIIFKPMIRLSTETDASFAPYSNICPISGRDSVIVDDTGVNIWDEQWEIGGIDSTTGQNNSTNNCIRGVGYIGVTPTQSIYLKFPTGSSKRMVVHWYDRNKNYIKPRSIYDNTIAVTVPSNAYYMRFYMTDEYGTTYGNNISVNYPSTFTDYVPYAHSSATIQLGTTVYGADINWNTGVMTVEWVEIAPTNIVSVQYNSGLNLYYWYVVDNITGINGANVISSHFEQRYEAKKGCCYLSNDGKIINAIPSDQTLNTKTLADAWMAANAPQFVYKLATPTTIQLTPTQLQMLKGYNRVTVESGTITLDYIAKAISGNDEEIAPLVGDKATKSYTVNDFIERNDGLYRVTAPIASGASFTANNTVKMSIGEALTYLYNK